VTLADASGHAYTLSAAGWFGAKGTSETDILVATTTEHLVIHTASGGVYAKVQAVEHFNITPAGKVNRKSFELRQLPTPLTEHRRGLGLTASPTFLPGLTGPVVGSVKPMGIGYGCHGSAAGVAREAWPPGSPVTARPLIGMCGKIAV
jgi:hypothetical protein